MVFNWGPADEQNEVLLHGAQGQNTSFSTSQPNLLLIHLWPTCPFAEKWKWSGGVGSGGVEGMKPHTKLTPHLGETREMIAAPLTEWIFVCAVYLRWAAITKCNQCYKTDRHYECVVRARLISCQDPCSQIRSKDLRFIKKQIGQPLK